MSWYDDSYDYCDEPAEDDFPEPCWSCRAYPDQAHEETCEAFIAEPESDVPQPTTQEEEQAA